MSHPPTARPPSEPDRPDPSGEKDAETGTDAPRPAEARPLDALVPGPLVTRPSGTGGESAWPTRFVRLGAARPGPEARRARWFGVPLLPLLTAGLVAGAFLTARSGAEGGGLADGRPGGDPVGAPAPVVTGGTGPTAGTADTPSAGTPPNSTATGGTRTASEDRSGRAQSSTSAEPTRSGAPAPANGTPSTGATPSGRPTGAPARERSVSYEALRVGDCFDIDRDAPGTALRRRCDTPHHAELVARPRLVGSFATDRAVREAATLLCREPLRLKAARQPLGTRWTTFVQYPYLTSHLLGADTVACSLAVLGDTLSHRLQ
ncbi:hypothetical protein ABTX77_31855 [Streptomyces sp. NPDC097704]|uniref:hypothetical protein n=1 Tax=Streptomyces sp. NPDC097704 TaxID=3157101 RepID=UPI0033187941